MTPDGTGAPSEVLTRCAALDDGRLASCAFATAEPDEASRKELGPHGGFGHRLAGLAVSAGRLACRQAGLADEMARNRLGCVLGTMFSGQTAMIGFGRQLKESGSRFVTPLQFPETVGNYAASTVARLLDLQGANLTVCAGANSGLAALLEACALLESGAVDHVIAGGADVLAEELIDGLNRAGPTPAPSLAGSAYAEGACSFVLEREPHARQRNATILALIEPLCGEQHGRFDVVAVDLSNRQDRRSSCGRQLDRLIETDAVTTFTAPTLIWGNTFAWGSAAQVATVIASLSGSPIPVISFDDPDGTLPTWSVAEHASTGLAVGGQNDPPELLAAITRPGSA